MNFNLSEIEFSKPDIKRGITLPNTLSPELAELIGIILGDGHISAYQGRHKNGKKYKHYVLLICGHLTDDYQYLNKIKKNLLNLFNINVNIKKYKNKNSIRIKKESKGLVYYLNNIFSIPLGNKAQGIIIPDLIMKSNKKIIFSFIRGLFDTDGSITFKKKDKNKTHKYPTIKINLKDKSIIQQLSNILNKYNIAHCILYNEKSKLKGKIFLINSIYISGKKNLKKWMKLIGFNNPKHLTKYQIYKKFGFCPPYTTIKDRRKILKGEINPYSYYTGAMAKQ